MRPEPLRPAFSLAAALLLWLSPSEAHATGLPVQFAPMAGRTWFDREFRDSTAAEREPAVFVGGRLGLRVAAPLWLEFAGSSARGGDGVRWSHLSANLVLMPSASHAVRPFVSLGGGVSSFRPNPGADDYDGVAESAAGLLVRVAGPVALRVEARHTLFLPREHMETAHLGNLEFGAGLSFGFGAREADTDGDGVPDGRDRCRGTSPGCLVDAGGCRIDTDADGVCDGRDRCPDTPAFARVDEYGCQPDRDGDGAHDAIDKCPDTPRGCPVDARGCPIDTDADGVCDGLDACPATEAGCRVSATGCPLDADGDSVCDGRDRCPDSPAGSHAGADGCVPGVVKQRQSELLETGVIRVVDVRFDAGRDEVLPELRRKLEVVGEVLSEWPQLQVEISGRFAVAGTEATGLALTRRRISAVRGFLLARYPKLQAQRLTMRGYGVSRTPAVRGDEAGPAHDHIELAVLDAESLKQIPR